MREENIVCGLHYSTLHTNSIYNKSIRGKKFSCPASELLSRRTVSLPMNEKLSFFELEYIVDKVKELI